MTKRIILALLAASLTFVICGWKWGSTAHAIAGWTWDDSAQPYWVAD